MPKLVIDDREIEVAPKTMVIEAAAQLGIMIPRFCYHPALGSVGACRVCAVKFLDGPLKGIQMSCMVAAQDGMVVSTTDPEAVEFRKSVIEWLMLHHPHDCPVCDAGGQCLLQDMTVSGGHGIRRYAGPKRTYIDQYLGPLVQHEMNRCIHCYRCSRYYQEFTGYHDLGVMRNANRTYFGRFQDGILESPFTGNLSDICPTGVYTDKPSRYFRPALGLPAQSFSFASTAVWGATPWRASVIVKSSGRKPDLARTSMVTLSAIVDAMVFFMPISNPDRDRQG